MLYEQSMKARARESEIKALRARSKEFQTLWDDLIRRNLANDLIFSLCELIFPLRIKPIYVSIDTKIVSMEVVLKDYTVKLVNSVLILSDQSEYKYDVTIDLEEIKTSNGNFISLGNNHRLLIT